MSTVSDQQRRELHARAEATWGREAADTLMAALPPAGYAELATKSDLALTEARLLAAIREQDAHTQERIAHVHEKIAEVHERIADVHERIAEVHEKIAGVHEEIAGQARWFIVALSGTVIAVSALPQVVDRLLGG